MQQGLINQQVYTYQEQDPNYKGQPFDYGLAEGPIQNRKCRDCFFLILYIAFWVGLIAVAIVGFSNGHPHLLASPFDSTGKQCGYDQGYQSYPYGFFNSHNTSEFACINSCPENGLTAANQCILGGKTFPCSDFGNYSTLQFVGICYPTNETIAQTIQLGLGFYDEAISDLKATWPISLATIFFALILSIVLLFLIRLCGGCLIIFTILLYFSALITFGILCIFTANNRIKIPGLDDLQNPQLLNIMAYISFAICGISLLVLLCCIKKIKIGIMLINTAAEFVQEQCQVIIVPIAMFVSIGLFFCFWIVTSIYIFSSGKVAQCHGSPYACIDWNVGVKRSLGYFFFGLFWNCEVAIGVCQFVLASCTSYWYFSHLQYKEDPPSTICKSFCRAMTYHLGSIAFGALVLCILVILQLFFQVLHYITKEQTTSADPISNACAKCCISYARCCLACFQRFIRFISSNAFMMMAITGQGFCASAHEAFYLMMRSAAEYAVTHGSGRLMMFFGKLLITALCTFIGYIMITRIEYFSTEIFSPVMPTIIFFVISFVISSLFMDVFGVGSDTLLMCYCLEKDILRGITRACPEKLKRVIEN